MNRMKLVKLKKLLAVLLCAVLLPGIVGCSQQSAASPITSAADLVGRKIAVQEGTTGDVYVTDEIEGSQVTRFKKATDAAMELLNSRVDAVVIDELPAKRLVAANEGKLKILDVALTTEQYAIALDKGQEELLGQINAAIDELRAEGVIDTLFDIFISGEDLEIPAVPEYTADGVIIMGTNAEFEPFEYRDDNNEITGFDVWMAKHIAAKLGKTLEINDMAFDSLIAAVNSGKVDFVAAGMTANDERRQNVDFTQDYFESSQVIIVRQ
ncbi:transporter substrate-binding domain-containing protein [Ruminococcaceae bacterium OttesenSCG-928-L11]|nr:transporter substrate-binding domain-containing protein [Ruminococcaceae bacterium OttesenSCG-928-L11]